MQECRRQPLQCILSTMELNTLRDLFIHELKDLYGEIGYTIIDDVLSLPERLPGIYRRLTT